MSGAKGLLNKTQDDPILTQAEQQVESKIQPEARSNYLKLVAAGAHAALANGPQGLLASLRNSKDPVADAARGAVSLVMILRREAMGRGGLRNDPQPNVVIPAAMTLMIRALEFIGNAGIAQVGEQELVRATHIFSNLMLVSYRITPRMIAHAGVKLHGITQDPVAMEQINRRIGAVRHPQASTATMPDMMPPHPPGI